MNSSFGETRGPVQIGQMFHGGEEIPEAKIIVLNSDGPSDTGLVPLELDPADFQSELPEQYWHVYFEDPNHGLTVGVWTTTSMQEAFGPYPGDEFMCLLEGTARMVKADGSETEVKAGQSFAVRNAYPVSWKQDGFLKKFFILYNRPDGVVPEIPPDDTGVYVVTDELISTAEFLVDNPFPLDLGGTAVDKIGAHLFTNDTRDMTAGLWQCSTFGNSSLQISDHCFVQILSGSLDVSDDGGDEHHFASGDVFFMPSGTKCTVESDTGFGCLFCTLSPPKSERETS